METLDATDLELIVFADECKCEYGHSDTRCSVTVTYQATATCVQDSPLVCTNAANRLEDEMSWAVCAHCNNRAGDCWIIRPI